MSDGLFGYFRSRFPRDLDAPFLNEPDRDKLTYADLIGISGRLANAFLALGVADGDRIAIQVEKSSEALLIYLAALRIGAVFLPLNPAYMPGELRYFLADAEPRLFVCRPIDEVAMTALVHEIGVPHLLTLGERGDGTLMALAQAQSDAFTDVDCPPDTLAAILYTSGTTGRSKGAMLSHANLRSNAETLRECWQYSAQDRLLHALPIFHTHGLFVATNITLASGASMIFLPRFDVAALLRHMPEATVLMGVPTFYTRLLGDAGFTRARAAGMRLFVSGSAPLSAETHREFAERTGMAILERYGMTETNMNTSNPYDGDRVPGSVGFPLPGVELRITEIETGDPVTGGVGVIEVRGPNVFAGYWRMPEKTAHEFRPDGFFVTGDLGRVDERGYVWIVGREKDLIIAGGLNIYPAEVEAELDAVPGIAESAVIGIPHADLGEAVVAVLVCKPGCNVSEADISEYLATRLARFKQPRFVHFVDELPRNAMGKVQKSELRLRYAAP